MTVNELIKRLKDFPPDERVLLRASIADYPVEAKSASISIGRKSVVICDEEQQS